MFLTYRSEGFAVHHCVRSSNEQGKFDKFDPQFAVNSDCNKLFAYYILFYD
ncbi:hypothetical protein LEP1GSC058_1137 [Leptospira fainei serovar Hurstbridge str. BUT 6]|uniref:Uncharacterized protein n=1 Tax=Leptospira fainei serovar Hurstbridge str. BUT 6 TaxID=1193011 RepID=S3UQ97_9LEPT|nr:hypothetical protein LEP1GSC058_1137 [Leptospira fainei serovar Hurstbridge str. BUT 6]